jgi:hypothetical protein
MTVTNGPFVVDGVARKTLRGVDRLICPAEDLFGLPGMTATRSAWDGRDRPRDGALCHIPM